MGVRVGGCWWSSCAFECFLVLCYLLLLGAQALPCGEGSSSSTEADMLRQVQPSEAKALERMPSRHVSFFGVFEDRVQTDETNMKHLRIKQNIFF